VDRHTTEDIIQKCLPTYEIIGKIGEGVNGTVYHVRDNLKERAVKVVPVMVERSISHGTSKDLDSKISHDFHAVQSYYSKIKGEGVVEIYDFHLVDKQVSKREARAYLVLLMEYCPENLLDRVLDNYPLSPKSCLRLMMELAVVLKRLCQSSHESFIVKDLKPSNLLLAHGGKLLIGDLGGLQRLSSVATSATAHFTPNWSAPEILLRNESAGLKSLMFSYGLVCYFIWQGALPYEDEDFHERIRLIQTRGLDYNRSDIPEIVHDLIQRCVSYDAGDRPADFEAIIGRLKAQGLLTARNTIPSAAREPAPLAERPERPDQKSDGRKGELSGPAAAPKPRPGSLRSDMHKAGATWIEPVTGMEFSWIPSGRFLMGCGSWDGEGKADESPAHEVYIDGFWMAKFPITQAQWKKVMATALWKMVKTSNPSRFKLSGEHPVEQVSWYDAQDFIQRLGSLNKGRYHFRLPTEAEWEYAARSCGRSEKFSGGNSPDEYAWYAANAGMSTQPVALKKPNELGLFDMSGNVYEWCLDIYQEDAYRRHGEKNPLIKSPAGRRVIRGGSWSNSAHELRCSYRASVYPGFKGNYIGFRIVMTPVSRRLEP
jgi:formylglycine-generating enzyme required for sulfatase activity